MDLLYGTIAWKVLLENYGSVFQQGTLFNDSVRVNIRLGKLDETDEQVREAVYL